MSSGFADQPWNTVFVPQNHGHDPTLFPINPQQHQDEEKTPPSSVWGSAPAPVAPPPPPQPAPRPPVQRTAASDPLQTIMPRQDFIKPKARLMMVQYHDGSTWHDLEQIRPGKHVLGRDSFGSDRPAAQFVAEEHICFYQEGDRLFVEEGETINGVYRRVLPGQPAELQPGTRFQVGQHVIEFVPAEPPDPNEPLVSPAGEAFRSRTLAPLAYLDFYGPDGLVMLQVPLTKPEGTVLGREGKSCDILLAGDEWASRAHAQVVVRDDRFFLEDLRSTNGTFVRILGRAPVRTGRAKGTAPIDELLIGAIHIRVVEP